jgi:hypothetical protein
VPQPTARQLQEPVWQVSWQLQELGLEVSEHLDGVKEQSGSIGPVAKERLDLSQLIVWQFQEPIWQVSRQLQGPGLEISERFGGFEGNIRQFRTGRKRKT